MRAVGGGIARDPARRTLYCYSRPSGVVVISMLVTAREQGSKSFPRRSSSGGGAVDRHSTLDSAARSRNLRRDGGRWILGAGWNAPVYLHAGAIRETERERNLTYSGGDASKYVEGGEHQGARNSGRGETEQLSIGLRECSRAFVSRPLARSIRARYRFEPGVQ